MTEERRSNLPCLALEVRNWSLPGAQRFLSVFNSASVLEELAAFILETLFGERATTPEVRSITIIVTSHTYMPTFQCLAFHSVSDLDNTHHRIEVAESFLQRIPEDRLRDEVTGVILHEMVHCFQSNFDKAPQGLIEGLADWVRLRRGLDPPHWQDDRKVKPSQSWHTGYQVTAYFLEYLETNYGSGTVAQINALVCSGGYSELRWSAILGNDVDSLWQQYCAQGL
ncbi:hypothetical protein GE09DRAFT_1172035 [Coniochaeta sp. 2T2.1]|nr:hypothetical protein GE09DRAFT_1172035 [Coniochaeta sp. 2T2.1]